MVKSYINTNIIKFYSKDTVQWICLGRRGILQKALWCSSPYMKKKKKKFNVESGDPQSKDWRAVEMQLKKVGFVTIDVGSFFLLWPGIESRTLHILCIILTNWAKLTRTDVGSCSLWRAVSVMNFRNFKLLFVRVSSS